MTDPALTKLIATFPPYVDAAILAQMLGYIPPVHQAAFLRGLREQLLTIGFESNRRDAAASIRIGGHPALTQLLQRLIREPSE